MSIVVPPGSISENQTQEVYFKVCSRGLPPFAPSSSSLSLNKRNGEQLLSPLVMCGPQGLRFNKVGEAKEGVILVIARFLDASTHLYKRVCPSVRPSVCPSVRP